MLGGRSKAFQIPLYLLLLNIKRVGAGRKVGDTFSLLKKKKFLAFLV